VIQNDKLLELVPRMPLDAAFKLADACLMTAIKGITEIVTRPGLVNLDFYLHKQFVMPYNEHHVLQFRFEAFNVLNHPNWAMPQLNILSGSSQPGLPSVDSHTGFGQVTTMVPSVDNVHYVATLTDPFPNGFIPVSGASSGLSTALGTSVSFFNPAIKSPYMERWQLAVQRSLPGQSVLEISYVGNHAVHQLVTRNLDALPDQYLSTTGSRDQTTINLLTGSVPNPFYPLLPGTGLSGTTVARSQLLEPYPEFTGVSEPTNQGYSFYNAMQVRYEKRFKTGLTATASYSWSKLIGGLSYLNGGDPMPERVISSSDRTHRLAITWIYALPFGHGQRWVSSTPVLSTVIGGWQLMGVYTRQSGPPLGFGNAILTCPVSQIALSGNQRTVNEWFNTACFNRVSSQQLASNLITLSSLFSAVRGDGIYQFDLSMLKNTRLREGLNLEIRAEAYNALNTPQFSAPTTSPTSSAFGTVTTQFSTPRTIQLAAKFVF